MQQFPGEGWLRLERRHQLTMLASGTGLRFSKKKTVTFGAAMFVDGAMFIECLFVVKCLEYVVVFDYESLVALHMWGWN